MIRIAAVGDIHYDRNSQGKLKSHLETLHQTADLLLLAGDLTQTGHVEEAEVLADDISSCQIPVGAVLGNHDYHSNQENEVSKILTEAGVHILEGNSKVFQIGSISVGVAGQKGFGGGFLGACGSDFGEPEMKAFVRHTKACAHNLRENLSGLNADYRIVLMHYSPISETLLGERREIYAFLGSYLFAEVIDEIGADIVFHGHAHRGVEKGMTSGGIPVRNVAQAVIRHAFNVYTLGIPVSPEMQSEVITRI